MNGENVPFAGPEPKTRMELEREVAEWKHNHRQEVSRARVLKERLDIPLERIAAYEQIGKLQLELAAAQELHRRDLDAAQELYDLRREVYRIGQRLIGDELDEQNQIAVGGELVSASGLCTACEGSGEDGDPDGGTYACECCNGTGMAPSQPSST
jgi:hypothetical protein